MCDILPFPVQQHWTRLTYWATATDDALWRYAGWLFADEDGEPDIPSWLGDAWREFVCGYRRHLPADRLPAAVDWSRLWNAFVGTVERDPRWRAAVEASLEDVA